MGIVAGITIYLLGMYAAREAYVGHAERPPGATLRDDYPWLIWAVVALQAHALLAYALLV